MEEILKKMPDFEPDDKFIISAWNKIDNSNTGGISKLFEIVVNFVFVLSIFVFSMISILGFGSMQKDAKDEVLVEIILVPKADKAQASNDNVLFVYDEAKNSEEIRADYEIEEDKLKLELKPGIYKIVFSSEEFQNVVLTKIVTKNG